MIDAAEQHRLKAQGLLVLCADPETLQPGLLDPITNIWAPTSQDFDDWQQILNEANLEQARNVMRNAWQHR